MKYQHTSIMLCIFFCFTIKLFAQEMISDVEMRGSGKGKKFGKMLYEKRKKQFRYAFTGQVVYQSFYDMRQFAGAAQDAIVFFPGPQNIDDSGLDIFNKDQYSMIGINASGKTLFVGPDLWGGKLVGRFEWGFGGVSNETIRIMNIKNAYISILWKSTELRFGHYFHPVALTTVYPTTVGGSEGLGYDPNRKSPMIRLIHVVRDKFKILMAAAKLFSTEEARLAVLPDLHFQVDYGHDKNYLFGVGIDYHSEVPRIRTESEEPYKTTESFGSIIAFLFARMLPSPFLIKTRLSYVENGTRFGVMGAYGVTHRNPVTDERLYTPMRALTYWADIIYLGSKKFEPAVFIGVSKGLGAARRVIKSYTDDEDEDVSLINVGGAITNAAYMCNISPRLRMRYNNVILGFEIEYSRAYYARAFDKDDWQDDFNCYGKVINGKPGSNTRFMFTCSYTF